MSHVHDDPGGYCAGCPDNTAPLHEPTTPTGKRLAEVRRSMPRIEGLHDADDAIEAILAIEREASDRRDDDYVLCTDETCVKAHYHYDPEPDR
jgi:hypothetical protein